MKNKKLYISGLGLLITIIGLLLMVYDFPKKVYFTVMSIGLLIATFALFKK